MEDKSSYVFYKLILQVYQNGLNRFSINSLHEYGENRSLVVRASLCYQVTARPPAKEKTKIFKFFNDMGS